MESYEGGLKAMEDDLENAPRFWKREVEEDSLNRPRSQNAHKCAQCGSVRWYPPLLTLSTLMSGVFCWLYVTKPMSVTQTIVAPTPIPPGALVQQQGEAPGNLVIKESKQAGLAGLNPEMGGLPGEANLMGAASGAVLPGQEIQPIVIPRAKVNLFKPMTTEEVAVAITGRLAESSEASLDGEIGASTGELQILPGGDTPVELPEQSGGVAEDEISEEVLSDVEEPTSMFGLPDTGSKTDLARGGSVSRVAISLMGELVADHMEAEAALADSKKE